MPNKDKKPHHRGQGSRVGQHGRNEMPTQPIDQSQFANKGRKAEGDRVAPADRPRHEQRPEQRHEQRNARHNEQRSEHRNESGRPPKFGDRKFAGGKGKQGYGKPRHGGGAKPNSSGNWMRQLGGN
jgi:hypothetical protein